MNGRAFKQLWKGYIWRERLLVTDKVLVTVGGRGRWGGGDHPLRFWQCRLTWRRREAQKETSGRRVFVQTVCGDEKWEGGKVNMGHSRGRSHVLSSVWKSKWLGPVSACSSSSTLCWAACPSQHGLMPPAGIIKTRLDLDDDRHITLSLDFSSTCYPQLGE